MSEDIVNELLELAEQVNEPAPAQEGGEEETRKTRRRKTKDEEAPAWGKKKRDELAVMVLNDIVRKLNQIRSVAASPVVRKDVEEIYKDLTILYRLLIE